MISTALSHAQQQSNDSAEIANRIVALDPRWTVSLATLPVVAPGFDQQMAYVPLESGEMLAIDLDEGRVNWTVQMPTTTTPEAGDGMVFLANEAEVLALDQRSGLPLWRVPVGAAVEGPMYWDSGWLLVSTAAGDLVALDATKGQEQWRNPLGSAMSVAPTSSHDRVYAALADGRIVALEMMTGQLVWTLSLDQAVTGLLALEDQLLVGSRANRLHSVSLDRGRIRWSQKAGADVIGAPAADEDNIYFVAYDNALRALNRRNGNLRWRRNLPSRPTGGALRVDDVVLVPFSTNDIGAYLATTGTPSFTIQAIGELGGQPFLRDHVRPTAPRLIAISREGALQGFAPRIEPPPSPLTDLPGARVGS